MFLAETKLRRINYLQHELYQNFAKGLKEADRPVIARISSGFMRFENCDDDLPFPLIGNMREL